MSASVVSSATALLDRRYSPPNLSSDQTDSKWSAAAQNNAQNNEPPQRIDQSHVESAAVAEPTEPTAEGASDKGKEVVKEAVKVDANEDHHVQRNANNDAQAQVDRRHALGGLLAALTTNSTASYPRPPQRRSVTPPVDSPISQTSADNFAQNEVKERDASNPTNGPRLPSKDPNNDPTRVTVPANTISSDPIANSGVQEFNITEADLPLPFSKFEMPSDPMPVSPLQNPVPLNVKRQIDAYARLEFADGTFYLNTFNCELGRDQHLYRDALKREKEAKDAAELEKSQPKSSSGRASQRSHAIKTAESQVQGSVVSDAGGFAGVDEKPVEAFGDKRNGHSNQHHSSQASESSVVRPAEVLHNPSLAPYDYHKDVVYPSQPLGPVPDNDLIEDERPAPVTTDHLPDPNSCPLIPIHTTIASDQTEAEGLRAISRRHIRIYWNWTYSTFYLEVLGRNGAFFEDEHMKQGESVRLYSGARIQISAVEFTFRLPDSIADQYSVDSVSVGQSEDALDMSLNGDSTPVRLRLNVNGDGNETAVNGKLKRKGPGRPPKNGVMSQREMKEREKAEKEAKGRGSTALPSPTLPRKPSKTQFSKPDIIPEDVKAEKRKYTKRKREDGETDEVIPSIEGQDAATVTDKNNAPAPPQPSTKRARTKSYSPDYKPQEECTPEDLARPPHNYAVLLYMVLSETGEITLRQIYKQMQARWPFFKYCVDSDGWTSSVRHNLNQEVGKLFERGRKEGKGFTWLPKPNAMEEYQAQKNKRSNAPPAPKPRPPPAKPSYPPTQGQQLTWQNNGQPPPQGGPGTQWPGPHPNNGRPGQVGPPVNGVSTTANRGYEGNAGPNSLEKQQNDPNYIPLPPQIHLWFGRPAPKFMPVTFEGLAVINRFESSMFQNLPQDAETQAKWHQIFASAKLRCLHGKPESSMVGGETGEEKTIMKHITDFVGRYKNPAFTGFNETFTSPVPNGGPVVPPSTTQTMQSPAQPTEKLESQTTVPAADTSSVVRVQSTSAPVTRPTPSSAAPAPTDQLVNVSFGPTAGQSVDKPLDSNPAQESPAASKAIPKTVEVVEAATLLPKDVALADTATTAIGSGPVDLPKKASVDHPNITVDEPKTTSSTSAQVTQPEAGQNTTDAPVNDG